MKESWEIQNDINNLESDIANLKTHVANCETSINILNAQISTVRDYQDAITNVNKNLEDGDIKIKGDAYGTLQQKESETIVNVASDIKGKIENGIEELERRKGDYQTSLNNARSDIDSKNSSLSSAYNGLSDAKTKESEE